MQTITQPPTRVNPRTRKNTERLAAQLQAARERTHRDGILVGEIEVYCQNTQCPVRTVALLVKEFDSKTPAILTCPACQKPLKLHHVQTLAEMNREDELHSRWSVNGQMYERDHPSPDGFVLSPVSVLLDDRLPPTPPGWWETRQ